jgi:dienelactone hydrolase
MIKTKRSTHTSVSVPLCAALLTASISLTVAGNVAAQTGKAGKRGQKVVAASAVRRQPEGLTFKPPVGLRETKKPGFFYFADKPDGSHIQMRVVLISGAGDKMTPNTSALLFSQLHNGLRGTVAVDGFEGYSVANAPTSLAIVTHPKNGKNFQTCQILAVNGGRLYQFDYSAPASGFAAGFVSFRRMMDSVRWTGASKSALKAVAATNSRATRRTAPAYKIIAPGVRFQEVSVPRPGLPPQRLWVYLPDKPTSVPLPCVFIAPPGSRMYHGMPLEQGEQSLGVPYAKAGFAVVAYAVDGPVADGAPEAARIEAARAFYRAEGGVTNARNAMDYALAKLKIDHTKLYTAGHSSAASLALQVAQNDARIKGCLAYAPEVDLETKLKGIVEPFNDEIPGFKQFVLRYSPKNRPQDVRCPLFLFQAKDDDRVNAVAVYTFSRRVQATNKDVTYVQVDTGGHFDAVAQEGIPQGIAWLKKIAEVKDEPATSAKGGVSRRATGSAIAFPPAPVNR